MARKVTRLLSKNSIGITVVAGLMYVATQPSFELKINSSGSSEKQLVNIMESNIMERESMMSEKLSASLESMEEFWQRSKFYLRKAVDDKMGRKVQIGEVDEEGISNFVRRFQRLAIKEQTEFGIPASVIIAHSLLQSQAGTAIAAIEANNFFSIPNTSDWQGDTLQIDGNSFRKYVHPKTSFRDNSYFLTSGNLSHLKGLESTDYKAWAKGIEQSKMFATDDYGKKIIRVIETLELEKLDHIE